MARQMPPKGFYVWDHHKHSGPTWVFNGILYKEIIYTTGVRGGGGHKYYRSDHNKGINPPPDQNKWPTLQWSCVPGKNDIPKYRYFRNLRAALAFYKS